MEKIVLLVKTLGVFSFIVSTSLFVGCSDDDEAPVRVNGYTIGQAKEGLTGAYMVLARYPQHDNESVYRHELTLYNGETTVTQNPDGTIQPSGTGDIFYLYLYSPSTRLLPGVYKWTKGHVSTKYTFQDSNAWYYSSDGSTSLGEFVGGEITVSKSGDNYQFEIISLVYVDLDRDELFETVDMKMYFKGQILQGVSEP